MNDADQPQLACPNCGHSLRGLAPLGPGQVLRCPECGVVTSIQSIAADFVEKRDARQRLPMTLTLAAAFVAIHVFIARGASRLIPEQQPLLGFLFFFGAVFSGWFTIPWHRPPAGARPLAMLGGGLIEVLAALLFHLRLAFLPTMLWCAAIHWWAKRKGIV